MLNGELDPSPFEVSEWVHGHTVALDCHVAYMTNRYSCQLPEKMLLKLLIMVNFRSFLSFIPKYFPDLTAE